MKKFVTLLALVIGIMFVVVAMPNRADACRSSGENCGLFAWCCGDLKCINGKCHNPPTCGPGGCGGSY